MKKIIIVLFLIFSAMQNSVFALEVFADKDKFGLKENDTIVVDAKYKKLIRLDDDGWLAQKGNRFGVIDNSGKILINFKYRNAERIFGKLVKLGNDNDYGLYNSKGEIIINHEYSLIEPLFGRKFLIGKKFKYGVCDEFGSILIEPKFEDIYMPQKNVMRLKYNGIWYEIDKVTKDDDTIKEGIAKIGSTEDFDFVLKVISGYSVVSATDYILKTVSSILPAYEDTIDELMLSKGVDTIGILMNFLWIPKFPVVYCKNYYKNFISPYNGPLSVVKDEIKSHSK